MTESRRISLTIVLAFFSGLLGDLASRPFLQSQSVLAQARPEKVIRAEEFQLVDSDGTVYASLSRPFGGATLSLSDKEGIPALTLGNLSGENGLWLQRGPLPFAKFSRENSTGNVWLQLRDENMLLRAALDYRSGNPALTLFHDQQMVQLGLGVTSDGSPVITMTDRNGKRRVNVQVDQSGNASIQIKDANGNDRAVLGATELVGIQTGSVELRPDSSLVLFDRDGKVLYSIP
jgi:hypothetical protein